MVCPKADREKLQALCQEIEQAYDDMADRLGSKDREKGTAAHAKEVRKEFDASVDALTEKLRALVETK